MTTPIRNPRRLLETDLYALYEGPRCLLSEAPGGCCGNDGNLRRVNVAPRNLPSGTALVCCTCLDECEAVGHPARWDEWGDLEVSPRPGDLTDAQFALGPKRPAHWRPGEEDWRMAEHERGWEAARPLYEEWKANHTGARA